VSFAIDELTKMNDEKSPLKKRLDLNRIGVAGHSFGAFTALATVGEVLIMPLGAEISFRDPRVKAAVAMSTSVPRNKEKLEKTFGQIKTPCLHMTGTLDESPFGDTKPSQRRAPFDYINSSHQFLITFTGGDHFIFSGRWREQTGGEHDKMFQDFIRSSSTAFWDACLKEDRAALKWLNEDFKTVLGDKGVFEKK
jgi:predicted dienelactone hydrolase